MATTIDPDSSRKLLLEIVSPDKFLFSGYVDQVVVPGVEGNFGILPGHCHFLSILGVGELHYRIANCTQYMLVLWGFAEVTAEKVTILAEVAERAEDIDVEQAQASVIKEEERLERGGLPSDVEEAKISLQKAKLRRSVADRFQKQTQP